MGHSVSDGCLSKQLRCQLAVTVRALPFHPEGQMAASLAARLLS